MEYIVRKAFKYGGKTLNPGEEFIPTGGKHDAEIVEQGVLVASIDPRINQRAMRRFGISKKEKPVNWHKKSTKQMRKSSATKRPRKESAHASA